MDPFIEARGLWADFRLEFLCGIRRALNATLPPSYAARVGHRSYVHQLLNDGLPESKELAPLAVPTQEADGSFVMHPVSP